MAKIVYIGSFIRLYDEEGIALSLEKLGHTVIRQAEQGYVANTPKEIVDLRPDFVLFAKLKIPMKFRIGFFEMMRKNHIPTICWIPDLFIGLNRERFIRMEESIFRADLVCTPDGGNDDVWKMYKVNHRLLRQGIYDEMCYTAPRNEVTFDVAFIGTANGEFPYRQTLMTRLVHRYLSRFKWFGKNNEHGVRGKELSSLIASVPVVIGDSVYSPNYWSNRIYETLGRGGFLIHANIPGLEKEFTYYKHFVPYDYGDFEGLFEKIDYYVRHEDERRIISEAGQKHVIENYTLIHRCKQLIQYYEDLLRR